MSGPPVTLHIAAASWPIAGGFAISRGTKHTAEVVEVRLASGAHRGHGECVPYGRYGETTGSVAAAIEAAREALEAGCTREELQGLMPAGAARNAVDCALWDLEAKRSGTPAWRLAGLAEPRPLTTAYTISLGPPEAMRAAAERNANRPLLKVKLGGGSLDAERIAAVRAGAPASRLIVDANEAWSGEDFADLMEACGRAGVELIEQPLPASDDHLLAEVERQVPVCADESVHDRTGLADLKDRYDAINVKLDKTGGLTEALALAEEAERLGFDIMVGCMLGSSLSMAPAFLVAQRARTVDLDGPLLLVKDRDPGIVYRDSIMSPPPAALWG